MDLEKTIEPRDKKDTSHIMMIVSLIISVILFITDLYMMINKPAKVIALAGITIVLAIWVYFFIKAFFREIQKGQKLVQGKDEVPEQIQVQTQIQEQYEELLKTGKATFLMLKKAVEQIADLKAQRQAPSEELITAQKAIAKVTLSRNKENTDALMNSNDKVIERLFVFEERLEDISRVLLDSQREILQETLGELLTEQPAQNTDSNKSVSTTQEELAQVIEAVNSLQVKIENLNKEAQQEAEKTRIDIENALRSYTSMLITDANAADEDSVIGGMAFQDEEPAIGEMAFQDEESMNVELPLLEEESESIELPLLEEESESLELPLLDEETIDVELPLLNEESEHIELPLLDEEPIDVELPLLNKESESMESPFTKEKQEPEPQAPSDFSNPGKMMSPEEIAALIGGSTSTEPEPKAAEKPIPKPEAKEKEAAKIKPDFSNPGKMMSPEEIAALIGESSATEPEPKAAEKPIPKPEVKEKEAVKIKPDFSNPGKMMSPEEIAALIGGTTSTEPEPVAEEPVSKEADPVKEVEESSEMPDLSNPHKLMTPDEIAALIANM